MSMPTPKKKQGPSPSHARAKVQEAATAKRINGRVTPGSGSKYQKGDVRLRGVVRVECKTTKNKSFSVTTDLIDKLDAAVFGSGELPMFEIELNSGTHSAVVLPKHAMDMIVELLESRDEV